MKHAIIVNGADASKKDLIEADFEIPLGAARTLSHLIVTDPETRQTAILVTKKLIVPQKIDDRWRLAEITPQQDFDFKNYWVDILNAVIESRNADVEKKRPTDNAIKAAETVEPEYDIHNRLRYDRYKGGETRPLAKMIRTRYEKRRS